MTYSSNLNLKYINSAKIFSYLHQNANVETRKKGRKYCRNKSISFDRIRVGNSAFITAFPYNNGALPQNITNTHTIVKIHKKSSLYILTSES